MRYLLLIFFLIITNFLSFSQHIQRSSLGMSGMSAEITNNSTVYYISQSIGQNSVLGTLNNQNVILRQGFQQPPLSVGSSAGQNINELDATIFPNPTKGIVNIVLHQEITSELTIQLFDTNGKFIWSETYQNKDQIDISVGHLSVGVYQLLVSTGKYLKSIKLIKI